MPDFWDYVESLKPEDWDRHIVYIYRTDPRASNYGDGQSYIDKCVGYIEMPDRSQVPFSEREEIERAIREKHGGRAFRLIIKRGGQRITEGKCSNEAPAKSMYQQNSGNGNNGVSVTPVSDASATADIAKAAMSTISAQEKQAIAVATDALRSTSEMVQRLARGPGSEQANSSMDDVLKQALVVMIQKAMNPVDPMEQLTKMFALLNQIRPAPGVDPSLPPGSPLNRVMDLALERLLNPASATPPVSASAELVRQLPMVAGHVTEAIREWRMGSEAQRDTAHIMRQAGSQPPAGPVGVNPSQQPRTLAGPNVAQPRPIPVAGQTAQPGPTNQEANTVAAPSLEFIETKIIEIFNENVSADQAADDCFFFLDRMDQKLIAQLAAVGEQGVMALFSSRPILRAATANPARLTEFIKAFLAYAKESLGQPTEPTIMPPGNA